MLSSGDGQSVVLLWKPRNHGTTEHTERTEHTGGTDICSHVIPTSTENQN